MWMMSIKVYERFVDVEKEVVELWGKKRTCSEDSLTAQSL
jgi:hypothetical protein